MINKSRLAGVNPKLQPKFVNPYGIKKCFDNHTYSIEHGGQSEEKLKLLRACSAAEWQAPTLLKERKRDNMKGVTSSQRIDFSVERERVIMLAPPDCIHPSSLPPVLEAPITPERVEVIPKPGLDVQPSTTRPTEVEPPFPVGETGRCPHQ